MRGVTAPRKDHLFVFTHDILGRASVSPLLHILPNHRGSSTIPGCTNGYTVVCSTLNINYFGIHQWKHHLGHTNLRLFVLSSHWVVLLVLWLSSQLSVGVEAHWVYKPTRSKEQSVLQPACHLGHKCWLDLLQRPYNKFMVEMGQKLLVLIL